MADFSELFKATVLNINNSNRLLAKEIEKQKQLEELKEESFEGRRRELDFND